MLFAMALHVHCGCAAQRVNVRIQERLAQEAQQREEQRARYVVRTRDFITFAPTVLLRRRQSAHF
jgi:hypothetical protein